MNKTQINHFKVIISSFFILSIVLSLNLISFVSAKTTYDSGWLCMEQGYNSTSMLSDYIIHRDGRAYHLSGGSSTCGRVGHYTIDTDSMFGHGVLTLKTPDLPSDGKYTFTFNYEIGSPADPDTEDFKVECGGKTYTFLDNIGAGGPEEYRIASIKCNFDKGDNSVIFTSLDEGSVHLEEFRIYKEKSNNDCLDNDNNFRVVGFDYNEEETVQPNSQAILLETGDNTGIIQLLSAEKTTGTLQSVFSELFELRCNNWILWLIIASIILLILIIIVLVIRR